METHYDVNQVNPQTDISSVDYICIIEQEKTLHFKSYLKPDLELCGLSSNGTIPELQERLKNVWKFFHKKEQLKLQIKASDYKEAMITIDQAVPCILHCEMRVGEKILRMLFLEGLKESDINKKKRKRKGTMNEKNVNTPKDFIDDVQNLVNTSILGSEKVKTGWMIPSSKENGAYKIGEMSISNKIVRKFMIIMDELIDFIIKKPERNTKWKEAIKDYKELIELARQKYDFTDEDIDQFQDKADSFFSNWVELHQAEGVTNYIHMLGSGHFKYYLEKHRNLYIFSQQGWESLNSLIKQFYFRHTQQGGFGGVRDVVNSKVVPIAMWMQRKIWWQSEKVKKRKSE